MKNKPLLLLRISFIIFLPSTGTIPLLEADHEILTIMLRNLQSFSLDTLTMNYVGVPMHTTTHHREEVPRIEAQQGVVSSSHPTPSQSTSISSHLAQQNGNDHVFPHSTSSHIDDYERESSPERSISPTRKPARGILRRFSFKSIRKSKLFKQNADDGGSDSHPSTASPHSRVKQKGKRDHKHKYAVDSDVQKEGIVSVLNFEDSKGKSKWEKTRLVLLKSPSGFQMEFFSPPKVSIKIQMEVIFLVSSIQEENIKSNVGLQSQVW